MKIKITGSRQEGMTRTAALIANFLDSIGWTTEYVGHNHATQKKFTDMKNDTFFPDTRHVVIEDNGDT